MSIWCARRWQLFDRLAYSGTPLAERLRAEGCLKGSYANYRFDFADPADGRLFGAGQVDDDFRLRGAGGARRQKETGQNRREDAGRTTRWAYLSCQGKGG